MNKKIWIVMLVIFLVACAPPSPYQMDGVPQTQIQTNYLELGVTRFIDSDADVVCWIYKGVKKGGISCLPISQTGLRDTE